MGPVTPGDRFRLSVLAPFNLKAKGAKVPDSNTVPSAALCYGDIVSPVIAADNDLQCTAFLPQTPYQSVAAPKNAGNTAWVWPAAFGGATVAGDNASIISLSEFIRPVGHAVRISSPLSENTANGFVHVAITYDSFYNQTTWPYTTTVSGMQNLNNYRRVTVSSLTKNPLIVINKYLDDTAFRYTDVNGTIGNATSTDFHTGTGWGTILVAMENCPIGAVSVESICHIEVIPTVSNTRFSTPAATPDSDLMESVAQQAADIAFSGEDDGDQLGPARDAVREFFSRVAPAVYRRVSQSAAAYVAGRLNAPNNPRLMN